MHNRLKTLALFFCSVVLALAAGEILTRWVTPQHLIDADPDIWRYDDRVGYRHKENADAIVNSGEGPHRFITDRNGYRVSRIENRTDQSADIALLAIGDSFIEGVSVENEQTIPGILANRLSLKYDLKVGDLNAGTSGWDPNYYLLEVRRSLAQQRVALGLVFLFCGNDIVAQFDTSALSGLLTNKPRAEFHNFAEWFHFRIIGPVRTSIEARSHLYILFKHQAYAFFSWLGISTRVKPQVFFRAEEDSPRWEVTANICLAIAEEFQSRNVPVIFVLLPPVFQVNENLFYSYAKFYGIARDSTDLEQPNRQLAAEFSARSLTLLDPLNYLREQFSRGAMLYGAIDRHFNASGHQAVAQFLQPYVEAALEPVLLREN